MNAYDKLSDEELSALVAEKIMGFRREANGTYRHPNTPFSAYGSIPPHRAKDLPRYASNISDAMQVVEEMRKKNFLPRLWAAQLWNAEFWYDEAFAGGDSGDLLPRAICIGALQAIEGVN